MLPSDHPCAGWEDTYLRQLCDLECNAKAVAFARGRLRYRARVGACGTGRVFGSIACGWRRGLRPLSIDTEDGVGRTDRVSVGSWRFVQWDDAGVERVH